MSEEDRKAAMEKASTDLAFLLAREGVRDDLQAKLFDAGITAVNKFAAFAQDADDLKQVLKDSFGLDSADGLSARVQVASIICAYRAALTRTTEVARFEGELEARQLTKPLPNTEYTAMRVAFEARWWRLEESEVPARTYLERRLEELEKGDMRAEPLSSVHSREEEEPELLTPVWSATGSMTLRRGQTAGQTPAGPETLRRKLALLGTGLIMVSYRHTNQSFLKNLQPQLFQSYLSYLLGDYVWNLVAKDSAGDPVAAPAWSQVVAYEFAIRKHAWALVQSDNLTFADALAQAWRDPTVKERNFTTPLAMATIAKRAAPQWAPMPGQEAKRHKGDKGDKGAKGGKGDKGSGKSHYSRTPDGRNICYRYNNKKQKCTNKKCKFVHCCTICMGDHPAYACKGQAAGPAEGQGETRAT